MAVPSATLTNPRRNGLRRGTSPQILLTALNTIVTLLIWIARKANDADEHRRATAQIMECSSESGRATAYASAE